MLDIRGLDTVLQTETGVVHALDALDLSIRRGETFAVVGESGCGKSMTALSILRLLPDNGRVARGTIVLERTDIAQLPESRMRDIRGGRISIIFQEPATSLNPVLPVGRQIVEAIERHTPLRGAAARERALHWLARVGLPEPARRFGAFPFQLSGGQKQRVMIAIALAAEPGLLIADEPTTALDVTIQRQILDLLRELQREQGMAMMLITHDLAIVSEMAHRVALMYAGQVVEVAETGDFFAQPLHPYAQALFGALPESGARGRRLAAIPGTVPPLDRPFPGCRFVERCAAAQEACRTTPPQLVRPLGTHDVRCMLYLGAGDGGSVLRAAEQAARRPAGGDGEVTPAGVSAGALPGAPAERPGASAAAPLLELVDYKVWFPIRGGLLQRVRDHYKAVDGISLRLDAGRTLALVGESGCGKTTTGKALLQLLRGVARIEGSARLEGRELGSLDGQALRQARRNAQIIFQDPFASLDPRMRVADILAEGVAALRPDIGRADRQDRLAALMQRVGLRPEALGRYPHEFSGGQRQRIAIARALAVEPKLIVCDEPTSALDVSVQAQILNLLAQLQRDLGIAYLFITHNFGVVEYLADEIAVMRGGRIVEYGAADRVLAAPQDDYTRTLLAAVPRLSRAA
ncbi:MAG TPA: dipeptide ABC transporter ATP-binding protein [Burkholderiaceae bacterium]|nr:dipeptide ABC transporter ATP-binding protein [Burkholderiaceae bacterium]